MIFDCPTKSVDVNGKARTRVCVDGMVKLVRELDLPPGTVAHLEVGGGRSLYASQSCFVQGAASGQWLGVLVSHGLDVRLVAASTWKWALKLARRGQVRDKNASRELAKRWISTRVSSTVEVCRRSARAAARSARASSEAGPTVMRLATARAANWGAHGAALEEEIRTIRIDPDSRPDWRIFFRLKRYPMPHQLDS